MVEIKTDDIELLKDVCEALAYRVARYQRPSSFWTDDITIKEILEEEGLRCDIY